MDEEPLAAIAAIAAKHKQIYTRYSTLSISASIRSTTKHISNDNIMIRKLVVLAAAITLLAGNAMAAEQRKTAGKTKTPVPDFKGPCWLKQIGCFVKMSRNKNDLNYNTEVMWFPGHVEDWKGGPGWEKVADKVTLAECQDMRR